MKVLVTGATGHLGLHVVHALAAAGHEVVACSRSGQTPEVPYRAAPASAGTIRPLAVDLGVEDSVAALRPALGPDVAVVHLAAWHPASTATTGAAERRSLFEVNVLGTVRLLDATRQAGARALVYASTFEVYGEPQASPMTEAHPTHPLTDYSATKLSGEDHFLAAAQEQSVNAVCLRLPAIYGPGERTPRALPNFLRAVVAGQRPRIAGDGLDQRDLVHVRDAAHAFGLALAYGGSGIFNVTDGETHTVRQMAELALRLGGLGGEPEVVERQKPRLDYHLSIERARSELGYAPQVTLEQGAAEQIAWLRAVERAV